MARLCEILILFERSRLDETDESSSLGVDEDDDFDNKSVMLNELTFLEVVGGGGGLDEEEEEGWVSTTTTTWGEFGDD